MADPLQALLLGDSDEENATEQAPSNGLSDSKTDFYSQLAAINSVTAAPPQPASNQPAGQAVTGVPAASPSANKGASIFDPAHVLANQQQKAAASRPQSADASALGGLAGSSAPRPSIQQNVAMPTHSGGMMYRPATSAAAVQPSTQGAQVNRPSAPVSNFPYIQELLAFADKRWQETHQVNKCKQARQLVQMYKTQRQAAEQAKDPSKPAPSQQQFQSALQKLVGPDLTNEFNLLRGNSGQAQATSSAQANQRPPQQLPGQQMRNGMQQQNVALPRAAVSQPQLRVNQHQHPQAQAQAQGQMPAMVRPPASVGFPAASQGAVKLESAAGMVQRQPNAQQMQHPQSLANGQQQPGMRAQSPGLPQQQYTGQPQQQGIPALGQGQPGMQPNGPGTAYAQVPAARPVVAKRPASAAAAAPAAKKIKQDEDGDEQNVLFVAGVDEDAEQEALLGRAQPSANRGPAPPAPRIINPHPLQAKVQEALQQYGMQGVNSTLQPYLNQAIWQHLESILAEACKMASQRADLSRKQEGMQITTDVRKALGDKARIEKEKALAKEEAERKALLEAVKEKNGDEDVQRKVKEVQKEELEKQNRAQTNMAIGTALGSSARWKNWGKKPSGTTTTTTTTKAPGTDAAAKLSSGSSLAAKAAAAAASKATAAQSAATPGASRTLLPPSRMVTEGQIVGLKDVISVMERHSIYCKSDLLYKMYDRLDAP